MVSYFKSITLMLVLPILITAVLMPSLVCGQITTFYGTTTGLNPVAFTLTTFAPVDQASYSESMPLHFDIEWNASLTKSLPIHPAVVGYAYAIDDYPLVNLTPDPPVIHTGHFPPPAEFYYIIDISNLANGYHKISINAYQYYDYNNEKQALFNQTSIPITFLVVNQTLSQKPTPIPTVPSPTPTLTHVAPPPTLPPNPSVPEFSWLMIFPILIFILSIAIIIRLRRLGKK